MPAVRRPLKAGREGGPAGVLVNLQPCGNLPTVGRRVPGWGTWSPADRRAAVGDERADGAPVTGIERVPSPGVGRSGASAVVEQETSLDLPRGRAP